MKVARRTKRNTQCTFDQISKLGPGKEMTLGIVVKVVGDAPKLATCKVVLTPRRSVRTLRRHGRSENHQRPANGRRTGRRQ